MQFDLITFKLPLLKISGKIAWTVRIHGAVHQNQEFEQNSQCRRHAVFVAMKTEDDKRWTISSISKRVPVIPYKASLPQ